jgi:hypothetical protein
MIHAKTSSAVSAAFFLAASFCAAADEPPRPGHLLAHTSWARLEIVFGRLRLTHIRLGQESKLVASVPELGVEETLSFSASTADSARLHYEYRDARQQWTVAIEQAAPVAIDRLPSAGSDIVPVRFRQPAEGNLMLVVEDASQPKEVVAESVWHLMLAEPELCRQHLLPILQALRTDWRLDEQAERLEAALLAAARQQRLPDTQRMRALVDQLADREFTRRQAADQQLRALGQSAAGFIQRLDEKSLDVEQRTRIREIRRALELHEGDTALRAAAWLIDDRAVWLTLLDRDDESQRLLAARHLQALLGQPLAFDPLASPAERRGQLRRLRVEMGLDRPVLVGDAGGDRRRF